MRRRGSRSAPSILASTSTRYKLPWLSEFPILPKQAFQFILHFHIMCFMEFTRQCIRSHTEKFANTVANAGESGAKYLLLAFERNLGSSVHGPRYDRGIVGSTAPDVRL